MSSENSDPPNQLSAEVSAPQLSKSTFAAVPIILALAILDKASSDYLDNIGHLEPALTGPDVVANYIAILLATAVFRIPIALLVWNYVLAPIAEFRRIGYWRACGVVAAFHWIALL